MAKGEREIPNLFKDLSEPPPILFKYG